MAKGTYAAEPDKDAKCELICRESPLFPACVCEREMWMLA